jgi:glycolate oxidase FAD binding subunit
MMEQVLQQLREHIFAATARRTALRICGGGSKDWYGQTRPGVILDTRDYRGIVAYDPTELVITARCGTPLAEIEAALAERKQMLAFEPPRFGPGSTIGGVVAAGLSGPRRATAGAVRDFVLGAALMNGMGDVLHFGGQVMKNVAGYDISRLLAGSMGMLGLILEVSLKVLPQPFAETSLRFALSAGDAIRRLNEWSGQPLPLSASVWREGELTVRLSGAQPALEAAHRRMGGVEVPQARPFWDALRDQDDAFFQAAGALWRLAVPDATPPIALPGRQVIEWGGAQRWIRTDADAAAVRAAAVAAGGHATLFRGGDKSVGVFHPLAPAVEKIHRNLKLSFDPAGIFNPGRMYKAF